MASFSFLGKFFPGHGGPGYCNLAYSQDDNGKSAAVFAEIKEFRKEIIVKTSGLDVLMRRDIPDEKRAPSLPALSMIYRLQWWKRQLRYMLIGTDTVRVSVIAADAAAGNLIG